MDRLKGDSTELQFERFVHAVTDDLVRTAYLLTWDLAEAEDLVQETLLRVARRWKDVRSMDQPRYYARRILVNLVIDGRGRRSRRRQELDSGDDALDGYVDEAAGQMVRAIDAASAFRIALAALPRRQRAVIVLRYWEDLPEAAVADLLGCSVGTVKSTTSRGVARLRDALGSSHSSPQLTNLASKERRSLS
jgi:RNA polymerase sigma-70 factor (sigma-E family)